MKRLVSIIVPVFRTENYILRCIDSIKKQTYQNIEIILVDDGSDDQAPQLCDRFAGEDSRIKVLHKENGGLSSARNTGIDVAHGEYISFVDSDDYIAEDMIETLLTAIEKNNAELAMVKYQEVKSSIPKKDTSVYREETYMGEEVEVAFHLLKIDSVCVGLYKKECIGDTRFPIGKTSEDIVFNFEIFKKCCSFVYIPIEKYYYYHNPISISNGALERNKMNYLNVRLQVNSCYSPAEKSMLYQLSGILVSRAAMGLMARMALYGIQDGMCEEETRKLLKSEFDKFKTEYYRAKNVPISRKFLAFAVMNFYSIIKIARRLLNLCTF